MRHLDIAVLVLVPQLLPAVQHTGSVRAADQFIPGATVTARNGGAKVVAYTDESGRYSLDLTPGVWEIDIEMFGFVPFHSKVEIGYQPEQRAWTLEVVRLGAPPPAGTPIREIPKPTPSTPEKPQTAATASTPPSAPPNGRGGRF